MKVLSMSKKFAFNLSFPNLIMTKPYLFSICLFSKFNNDQIQIMHEWDRISLIFTYSILAYSSSQPAQPTTPIAVNAYSDSVFQRQLKQLRVRHNQLDYNIFKSSKEIYLLVYWKLIISK